MWTCSSLRKKDPCFTSFTDLLGAHTNQVRYPSIKLWFMAKEHAASTPAHVGILTRLIQYIIPNDGDGLNLKGVFCVALARYLRSGEFMWESWKTLSSQSHLSRTHFSFNRNNSVTLKLPASKTDPCWKNTPIHLSQSSYSLCPSEFYLHYSIYPQDGRTIHSPHTRSVHSTGHSGWELCGWKGAYNELFDWQVPS